MNMKTLIAILTFACIVASPTARVIAQTNIENDPAFLALDKAFDFKTLKPQVNINLPKFLLKDALADLSGKDDPFAGSGIRISELIQDIKLIRVVVLDAGKEYSEAVAKGMAALKSTLEKSWTPIAVVGDGDEKVGIYAISDPSGESTAGLALLVHDGNDAVIANVVGRVSLGKILKIASHMDKFPKDFLKKLTSAAESEGSEKPKASPEKPTN